jgi:hypothetical protein
VNTEEQQLAEMLRRVAPEPPRPVTVEDVAFRLAPDRAGSGRRRPRERRGPRSSWVRSWAPVLAAASVIVVAGASAGIATVVSSHRSPASYTGGVSSSPSSPKASASVSSAAPSVRPTSAQTTFPPGRVANGMWGAELINRDSFNQDSLTSGAGSLYAVSQGYLNRINPATGDVVASVPYTAPIANPPVITGNTVWVVWSYAGTSVVLRGYDSKTLTQLASVTVPVSGQLSTVADGVLTTGSGGDLYLAAGSSVAVVDPGTRQLNRISVPAGPVSSVAISPDGSKLYVSTGALDLLTYNPATGAELGSSTVPGLTSTVSNLMATSGGVWGTSGVGMTQSAWFAPDGDLTRMVRLGAGAGAGLDSIAVHSGGTVWIGGSHTLICASPVTGQALATATIPTDHQVVEYFGSVTVLAGHAYAYYVDQQSQQQGVVTLTPPAACSS